MKAISEDHFMTQEKADYIILSEKGCLLNCIFCIIPSFVSMTSMSSSRSFAKNVNRWSLDHMPWKGHQSEPFSSGLRLTRLRLKKFNHHDSIS